MAGLKQGQNPAYFDAHWELPGAASLREHPQDLLGQILWGANNIFWVACEDGRERRCRLRGKTLGQKGLEHNPLSCGDFVLLCVNSSDQRPSDEPDLSEAQIYCRLERRNALQRRNLKRGEPQTFAANIDGVILLLSWAEPKLRSGFLDRLWIAAQRSESHTLVLLNKIDCINNLRELREMHQILRRYRRLGLEIWPVCVARPEYRTKTRQKPKFWARFFIKFLDSQKSGKAKNPTKLPRLHGVLRALGLLILEVCAFLNSRCTYIVLRCLYLPRGRRHLNRLYALLANRLYALLGASGAGKSSLCNYLFHTDAQQVQAISEKWQRGVHTTTLAKIIEYREKDAYYRLIDTPGLRNFLPDIRDLPNLQDFYPEFSRLRSLCSYAACEHRSEPGCAVRDALELGLLSEARYRSYWNLYNDLQESFAQKPEYRNTKRANAGNTGTKRGGKVSGRVARKSRDLSGPNCQNVGSHQKKIRGSQEWDDLL